ncbi:MAG: tetratricopeptide repeat protein [Muribaculaceae bacterium]|nr:tetratricopeptide repeat protein [Muribaculaceae bacterium]
MKLKSLLIGVCIVSGGVVASAESILDTDAGGYLARGVDMYVSKNYTGAIDQLSHAKAMSGGATLAEEADFYIAMSYYNSGNSGTVDLLNGFLTDYPNSQYAPEVIFALGNKYFFAGKYGEAIVNYSLVYDNALDKGSNSDLIYRRAYSELRLGNYPQAGSDFARIANVPKYRQAAIFYQGYIDYANDDCDAAMAKFNQVSRGSELAENAEYYITQIYFKRADYSKVTSRGGELLQKEVSKEFAPELNRIVGESYYNLGDDAKAESYLTKYFELCDELTSPMRSASYIMGIIYQRKGNNDMVVKYMGNVTDADDALAQSAYLYTGQAYIQMENYSGATIAFEKAMQMPHDPSIQETAFFNYAVSQSKSNRTPFSRAIDFFEEFLNKYPDSRYQSDVDDYLVNAYITSTDYTKALTSIENIKKPSEKVLQAKQYVLYKKSVDEYSNNNIQEAKAILIKAIALGNYKNGVYADCALWLGDCLYDEGNYSEAQKKYSEFLSLVSISADNYSLGHYNLGYALFQQKYYDKARTAFERGVAKGTKLNAATLADAYARIGDTHYYAKNYGSAADNYSLSIAADKSASDYALFQEAMMNGLQKQYSAKIKKLDALVSAYPNSNYAPMAMFEKAQAQLAINDNSGAESTFEKLLVKYSSSVEARKGLLQLAITKKNIGKEQDAIATYKKVISRYPSSEEAMLAAEDMKVIYADNNDMENLTAFLERTPNAPKIDVSELDRIAYYSAEKAYTGSKQDITKMKDYIKKYPEGAFVINANFYIAKDLFVNGKYDKSLSLIDEVLEKGNDAAFAEDALVIKGEILMKQKREQEALNTYKTLSKKATTPDNHINAGLGIMRAATVLGHNNDVIDACKSLLAVGGLSAEEEKEAIFLRASALSTLKRDKEAVNDWSRLAKDPRSLYGAKSAFSLAEHYYNKGSYKEAEKTINSLIDEGTPHQYWLARGFILLSDVYKKQGNNFEAREYLESLKANYPGTDTEIFKMIDERLKSLKK